MSAAVDLGQAKEGRRQRRTDIQVMRGVAVLAVILFHSRETSFSAGYLGVDVFFVISGFVVTPLIARIFFDQDGMRARKAFSGLWAFYTRRFYRLAPALGVTLLFSLFVILLLGPVSDHVRFASQGLAALFLIGNFGAYHYSGGNYFAPNPNPLIHLWSLSAEEQIYILLPIVIFLLLFITRRRRHFSLQLSILFLGIFAYFVDTTVRIFPQLLQSHGISDVPGLMFYTPISRLWEFCIGSTAYFLSLRTVKTVGKFRNYLNVSLMIFLGVLLFLPISEYKFQSVVITVLAAVAMYFRSFEELPSVLRDLGGWLGDRSYSIYLVHMPLLYVAIYSPIFSRERILATIVAFATSILLGAVIYQSIEERFRIKSTTPSSRVVAFPTVFISFVLIPILLFTGMRSSAEKHYWGFDPNPTPPLYASTIDHSCYLSLTPCAYPVSNSKGEALLIGDSHAASLFQTFVESTTTEGISSFVWQKSGCQFISREEISSKDASLLRYGIVRPGEKESCFSHNESIIRWIRVHPKAFVFISQRSSSIRPAGMSEGDYRNVVYKNLIYLRTLSARLTVIGPNPEFPDATQFFQGGLLLWQKAYIPPRYFPTPLMIGEPARDNAYLSAHLASKGIGYIDSITPFCTSQVCSRWDQSKWLYVDHDHLSLYGAERLKPSIREQIMRNLK